MSGREREAEPFISGGSSGTDWLHSFSGGGDGHGSQAKTEGDGHGIRGAVRGGETTVDEKTWFDPVDEVSECPGGVCPVPWATGETVMGRPTLQPDFVNHPSHYNDQGSIECIEAIEAQLTPEEYQGFLRGNCVKYLWRWKNKGGVEDLKKCRWYLDLLIGSEEN